MVKDQTRRNVLRLVSATGFALGSASTATAKDGHSDTKTESTEGVNLSVENPIHSVRLETGFVYQHVDWGLANPSDKQFVFANIYSGLPRTDLFLQTDGEYYQHGLVAGQPVDTTVLTQAEDVERLAGFEIPRNISATTASIVLKRDGGEEVLAEFSDELIKELNNPADFEVRNFSLPQKSKADENVPVITRARNHGGRTGTFFGLLNVEGYSDAWGYFADEIPKNASRKLSIEFTRPPYPTESAKEYAFSLSSTGGNSESKMLVSK